MADQPLIVCPVCETRQPNAWFCAVCGKALHALPKHLPVATPALEDLELTVVDPARVNVAVYPIEGLEATRHAPVAAPADPIPEVEPTILESPSLPAETLPGFEATGLAPSEEHTAYGPVTCKVCGTPWVQGTSRFCARCGVRLSIPEEYLGVAPPEVEAPTEERVTCPSCSARGQVPGGRCLACGRIVPPRG